MTIAQVIQFLQNVRNNLKQSVRTDMIDGLEIDFTSDKRVIMVRNINRFIQDLQKFQEG